MDVNRSELNSLNSIVKFESLNETVELRSYRNVSTSGISITSWPVSVTGGSSLVNLKIDILNMDSETSRIVPGHKVNPYSFRKGVVFSRLI